MFLGHPVWHPLALLLLLQLLLASSYVISYAPSTLPKLVTGSLFWTDAIPIGSIRSALGVLFLFICSTVRRPFFLMLSLSSAFQSSWNQSSTPLTLPGLPLLWTAGHHVASALIGMTLLSTILIQFASRILVSTLLLVKAWSNG